MLLSLRELLVYIYLHTLKSIFSSVQGQLEEIFMFQRQAPNRRAEKFQCHGKRLINGRVL